MKQSNIILGIGVIVAVILIIGSFFIKSGPAEPQSAKSPISPTSLTIQSVKNVTVIPFRTLSKRLIKLQ